MFDGEVEEHFGATQGAEITFLRKTDRVKFETIELQPELAAVRIPGVGHEWMQRFGLYPHFAQWAMVVRAEAEGTVRPAWAVETGSAGRRRDSTWSAPWRAPRCSRG